MAIKPKCGKPSHLLPKERKELKERILDYISLVSSQSSEEIFLHFRGKTKVSKWTVRRILWELQNEDLIGSTGVTNTKKYFIIKFL